MTLPESIKKRRAEWARIPDTLWDPEGALSKESLMGFLDELEGLATQPQHIPVTHVEAALKAMWTDFLRGISGSTRGVSLDEAKRQRAGWIGVWRQRAIVILNAIERERVRLAREQLTSSNLPPKG